MRRSRRCIRPGHRIRPALDPNVDPSTLKLESRDGEPALHIHDTDDLDADLLVIGADPMELQTYGWVSNEDILMVLHEKIRDRIVDQNEGVYA